MPLERKMRLALARPVFAGPARRDLLLVKPQFDGLNRPAPRARLV